MNKKKYLQRIGHKGASIDVNFECLKSLHTQHLLCVPFENLDIHRSVPIDLDVQLFYRKIVGNNRGGFCYELNGGFYELLCGLGFETKMVSARVAKGDGGFGPAFDHMALIVKIDGGEYLADVGFGDFIAAPLKFEVGPGQIDPNGEFRIVEFEKDHFGVEKLIGEDWKSIYIFNTARRALNEFSGMCEFHQTSAESHFTKGRLCSLMTVDGRKTLTDSVFIETIGGKRTEAAVGSESEFDEILEREFNIPRVV